MLGKLKSKKGFTLIEMLVVIAIIAVLVAIIIPVVSNSTTKAAAATNAANLRAYKAELTIAYLNDGGEDGDVTIGTDGTVTYTGTTPESVKCGKLDAGVEPTAKFENDEFVVTYGGITIEQFTSIANGTSVDKVIETEIKASNSTSGG